MKLQAFENESNNGFLILQILIKDLSKKTKLEIIFLLENMEELLEKSWKIFSLSLKNVEIN